MTDRIFQCCYTNVTQETGGRVSSGWQTVAVSGDIPAEAYKHCERLQTANSTIQGSMTDEDGGPLNLLEICGDERYVYIIRTQYGNLVDRLGRANMFSHGFILPWKDVLSDPNLFLPVLDRANFRESEEAARELLEKEPLEHVAPWEYTIQGALKEAGISPDVYPTLIQCIYAQMSSRKIQEPLYIQCDGEEQMRALLFCIYYGLPYYLRRKLHAASAAGTNTADKNVIFSKAAGKHAYYINPATGENTALSARTQRKIARYGFIDYAAINLDDTCYFARLEAEVASLGDASGSNELFLKLAHKRLGGMTVEKCSHVELYESLSDALRSQAYTSAAMRDFVTQIMERVTRERCSLTDENRLDLEDWEAACALAKEEEGKKAELDELRQSSDARRQETEAQLRAEYEEIKRRRGEAAQREIDAGRDAEIERIRKTLQEERERAKKEAYDEAVKWLAGWREQEREKGEKAIERDAAIRFESNCKRLEAYQGEGDIEYWKQRFVQDAEAWKEEQREALNKRLEEDYNGYLANQYGARFNELTQAYAEREAAETAELRRKVEEALETKRRELDAECDREAELEISKQRARMRSDWESGLPAELKSIESKEKLMQAIERYTVFFLLDIPSAEAVRVLGKMKEKRLLRYTRLLADKEKGKAILDSYYASLLEEQPLSWELLYHVMDVSSQSGECPQLLQEKILNLAETLYSKAQEECTAASEYPEYIELMERILPPEQVAERGKKAKSSFWEHLSLEGFSPADFSAYMVMNISTERYKMFHNFYILMDKMPSGEEDFLSLVQEFFTRSDACLRREERSFAVNYIREAAKKKYDGSDPLSAEWVELAALVETEQLWKKILAVRRALYGLSYDALLASYDQFLGNGKNRSSRIIQQISEIVIRFCARKDSEETPVPLDVWLMFSGDADKEASNIFAVFDGGTDAVCMAGIFGSDAVPESELLRERKYRRVAEDYIQRHGKEFRKVKKWLNELSAPGKNQRGGKREEHKGFFGR